LNIKLRNIFALFSTTFVMVYTFFWGSFFVAGDQIIYRDIYYNVQDLDIFSAYAYYRSKINSDEIGHFVIVWLASPWFDKDVLNAASNAALAFFSYRVFVKWKAHYLVAFFLVAFGYYYLAIYLSAERLKYAALFYVVGVNLYYSQKYRVLSGIFFLLSLITHLQFIVLMVVFLSIKGSSIFSNLIKSFSIQKKDILITSFCFLAILLVSVLFSSHITSKILAYHSSFGIYEYGKIFVFFLFSFLYSSNRLSVLFAFLPLFLAVSVVGDMRINVFGYFVFLYFSLPYKKGFNFGVMVFLSYFLIGWVEYSLNVFNCGVNRSC
jgi:hypothetical protein